MKDIEQYVSHAESLQGIASIVDGFINELVTAFEVFEDRCISNGPPRNDKEWRELAAGVYTFQFALYWYRSMVTAACDEITRRDIERERQVPSSAVCDEITRRRAGCPLT